MSSLRDAEHAPVSVVADVDSSATGPAPTGSSAVELSSPAWPRSHAASVLLMGGLTGALGSMSWFETVGALSAALLVVPAALASILVRLTFEALAFVLPRRRNFSKVFAAGLSTLVGQAVVALTAFILTAPLSIRFAVVSWAIGAVVLLAAATTRGVELRVGASARRVFFIGDRAAHADLAREIRRRGDLSIVGCLRTTTEGAPVDWPSTEELVAEILRTQPTALVMSAEAIRDQHLVAVASRLNLQGLRVRTLGDYYEREFAKVPLAELSPSWFLFDVAEIHQARVYGVAKRIVESLVAGLVLILTAPLMAAVALAVKLDDGGDVLFRQERRGKHGTGFSLTKFRTMRSTDSTGAAWASSEGARITRVGVYLRRYRIDELPQLWNVLRGQLSLVGPRPEQPELADQLTESIEFYAARECVRPGLTGWAQVNYGYGGSVSGTLEKLQFDIYYIKRQRVRLDLLILAATVRTVLGGRGR